MNIYYILNINFTKNNIIITLTLVTVEKHTQLSTKLLYKISSGQCGFKHTQKQTPFACVTLMSKIIIMIQDLNLKHLIISFKGENPLYKIVLDILIKVKFLNIDVLIENTRFSYNGCLKSKNTNLILNENL